MMFWMFCFDLLCYQMLVVDSALRDGRRAGIWII